MKAILFASSAFAGSTGAALAGEGFCEYFSQVLPDPLQTYAFGRSTAPARPVLPAPACARLLPSEGTMAGLETLNSRPVGAAAYGYA